MKVLYRHNIQENRNEELFNLLSLEVTFHHRTFTFIKVHHPVQVLEGVHLLKDLVSRPELYRCFYLGGDGR